MSYQRNNQPGEDVQENETRAPLEKTTKIGGWRDDFGYFHGKWIFLIANSYYLVKFHSNLSYG